MSDIIGDRESPPEPPGKAIRRPLDAYDTPPELAEAIVADVCGRLPIAYAGNPIRVLEPTAGTGSFVGALREHYESAASITAVDVNPECGEPCLFQAADRFLCRDVLQIDPSLFAPVDLAIGNPPFSVAEDIIRHLWGGLRDGASISFLLAITFWAGKNRWEESIGLYRVAPLRWIQPVTPRPYFGLDNDPKFECAVFTWTKGYVGQTTSPGPIVWEKKGRKDRAPGRGKT